MLRKMADGSSRLDCEAPHCLFHHLTCLLISPGHHVMLARPNSQRNSMEFIHRVIV